MENFSQSKILFKIKKISSLEKDYSGDHEIPGILGFLNSLTSLQMLSGDFQYLKN